MDSSDGGRYSPAPALGNALRGLASISPSSPKQSDHGKRTGPIDREQRSSMLCNKWTSQLSIFKPASYEPRPTELLTEGVLGSLSRGCTCC